MNTSTNNDGASIPGGLKIMPVADPDLAKMFPYPLGVTHDLYGNPVAGIEMHGFTIHNASVSSCGRFQVDPSHYQLTAEQGRALNSLNAVVKAAAESAINAGCREIQDCLRGADARSALVTVLVAMMEILFMREKSSKHQHPSSKFSQRAPV